MKKLTIVFILSLLLFASFFTNSTIASSSINNDRGVKEGEQSEISDAELQKSLRFRESFGLDQSMETINKVHSEKVLNESENRYGVPLTDAEFQEILFRENLAEDAAKIRSSVIRQKYKSIFSELYMDHMDGGKIKIGIVDLEKNRNVANLINNEFKNKERVEFFNTNVSYDELKEIQADIINLYPTVPIENTDISIQSNKVVVGLSEYDEKWVNLIKKLSSHVEIKLSDDIIAQHASRTAKTRPLIGGLAISSSGGCTGAFSAKMSGPTSKYYYLTAAHCGNVGSSWTQGGEPIGTIQLRNYGGNSDIAAIEITKSNTSFQFYEKCATCNPEKNKEIATVSVLTFEDVVGDTACKSGKTTEWSCGLIYSVDYSHSNLYGDGVSFTNLRRASFYVQPGDSGGPVVRHAGASYLSYEYSARGIVSGYRKNSNDQFIDSIYSAIGYAYNDLLITHIKTNNMPTW